MIEELAVVVKVENHQVWVESAQNSACDGCLQKTACTTNAIGNVLKKKAFPVDCDIALKIGDNIIVAIDGGVLLGASLLLYLLPLIALFIGAGIANWLLVVDTLNRDLWIASSGLLSFSVVLWLIKQLQKHCLFGQYARPVVVKKL